MIINTYRLPGKPRSKRWLTYAQNTSSGIGNISVGGGSSITNYVRLKGEESQEIDGTIAAGGDIVAYSSGEWDLSSPIASTTTLGMIKLGTGLSADQSGVVSVTGGTGSNEPGGIGSLIISGSGNAVTTASLSSDNTALTLTKGSTFALATGSNTSGTWPINVSGTSGSAGSANSLTTTRSLWGQAFNGTSNVSGSLSNVGSISFATDSYYNIGSIFNKADNVYSTSFVASTNSSNTSATCTYGAGYIELYYSTPFIDFHYNNNASDYTSRLIANSSSSLYLNNSFLAGGDIVAYSTGNYDLSSPVASASNLGMIRVGSGLSINNGVLSATGGGSGGTGNITISNTGTGNAITSLTASGSTITATKGATYATTSALTTGLASKQNTLSAGSGISISGNVISATGGGSGGSSAVGTVQYYAGNVSSPTQTYSSGCNIKCGYYSLSGNIPVNSYFTVAIPMTTSNTLSVTANAVNWNGANTATALNVSMSTGTGGGQWYATLYNTGTTSISLTGLRLNYIAIGL